MVLMYWMVCWATKNIRGSKTCQMNRARVPSCTVPGPYSSGCHHVMDNQLISYREQLNDRATHQ